MVIYPPKIVDIDKKIIFLAGPIQGAEDWQSNAIKMIQEFEKDIVIANPRKKYIGEKFIYENQVDWETYFLKKAAKNGVILFWLAKEKNHFCERAYAQTTRFELSEWKTRAEFQQVKIVVGIEEGFSNARYIKRRLLQDTPQIPICYSLESTCKTSIKLTGLNY